jgi:hypothetical protein
VGDKGLHRVVAADRRLSDRGDRRLDRAVGAGAGDDLSSADQKARVDAGEIADQDDNDDGAEAEPACAAAERNAAARAAAIVDIRRLGGVFPVQGVSPGGGRRFQANERFLAEPRAPG